MNKAIKGNQEEIFFTQIFNKKDKYWDILEYDKNSTFAIHIISKKFGQINDSKISCKADIFFAKGVVNQEYLVNKNYYLNETDCELLNLEPISNSGLSIKLSNSNYTIAKISPNTFFKIFNNNILGAGASIYCKKENEFIKNIDVLNGWNITENLFISYFSEKLNEAVTLFDKDILKKIKSFSNQEISNVILNSNEISNLLFKGIGNFEEPYTANWIIENNELKLNYFIPFSITTGSGRSKGIFTIVLKPK